MAKKETNASRLTNPFSTPEARVGGHGWFLSYNHALHAHHHHDTSPALNKYTTSLQYVEQTIENKEAPDLQVLILQYCLRKLST